MLVMDIGFIQLYDFHQSNIWSKEETTIYDLSANTNLIEVPNNTDFNQQFGGSTCLIYSTTFTTLISCLLLPTKPVLLTPFTTIS